jgi:DNA-binding response OmpR family regulator
MTGQVRKKRIDEILLERGLITQEALKEALLAQKTYGGRIGSHLLRRGHLDESDLVEALATQLGCPGVVLSSLRIPSDVVRRIPEQLALSRKVVPFEYDAKENTLKIACEDPTDDALAKELRFIASGMKIELHIAAQTALDTAIARYYLGREAPDEADQMPAVLFVTDEEEAILLVQTLLQKYNYEVATTDSTDNIVEMLQNQQFHTVFVRESLPGSRSDLVERVRQVSPSTVVRYYDNVCSMLLGDSPAVDGELFLKNLDLLTALLASKAQLPENHSIRVAQYVERLCRKLRLPDRERLVITNAAYVADLAASYYGPGKIGDAQQTIQTTINLLGSLEYSPSVLQVLRHVYADMGEGAGGAKGGGGEGQSKGHDALQADNLPVEVLGGNIITAVDLLCREVSASEHLSLDRFDAVQSKLRQEVGRKLLPEVAEALVQMLHETALESRSIQRPLQLMVFCEDAHTQELLEARLKNEGFRAIMVNSHASLAERYQRSEPDLLILAATGSPARVLFTIDEVTKGGIDFKRTPTLLLIDAHSISRLLSILARGMTDVILLDPNLDILIRRVRNLAAGAMVKYEAGGGADLDSSASGTQGRLTDMNLFDLLQALGLGRKTVKITISPNNAQAGRLVLYLSQGSITFAKTEQRTGASAVHEALSWAGGTWKMEPVAPEDLPAPNNKLSNESILMEWCRLQDEAAKVPSQG